MIIQDKKWNDLLKEEFTKLYFLKLRGFLAEEYQNKVIFPPQEEIFESLRLTPYQDVKVVIIGQDPYHQINQAHGLAFSVKCDKYPPSLKNIFKEIQSEYKTPYPQTGNLSSWAKQGVLLLNTVLTVRENEANSHQGKGWEIFTDRIIELLNQKEEPIIFLLWGNYAQKKEALIDTSKHFVLKSAHPSPLSAYHGFFGCNHFLKVNQLLKEMNKKEIDFTLQSVEF